MLWEGWMTPCWVCIWPAALNPGTWPFQSCSYQWIKTCISKWGSAPSWLANQQNLTHHFLSLGWVVARQQGSFWSLTALLQVVSWIGDTWPGLLSDSNHQAWPWPHLHASVILVLLLQPCDLVTLISLVAHIQVLTLLTFFHSDWAFF